MTDDLTLIPSKPRRIFATGCIGLIGGLSLILCTAPEATDFARVSLACVGAGTLLSARVFWTASNASLHLKDGALVSSDGELLTTVENISSIDRGTFAFKPSSGFLIRTHDKAPRRWVPGLWWRFGKRIGVGGVFPSAPAKMMAEALAAKLST